MKKNREFFLTKVQFKEVPKISSSKNFPHNKLEIKFEVNK